MSVSRSGTTRFATRGHYRLSYAIGGVTDSRAPVVVLLHALLAGRSDLAAQRYALSPAFRVVQPEARGHGASAALANQRYTVADMVAEVLTILDAEGITSAHLVGHEMGGTVALELARSHPDRARSLTLIEPALAALLESEPDPEVAAAHRDVRQADRAAAEAAYKGLTDRSLDLYLEPRWGRTWRDHLPRPRLAAIRRHAGALAASLAALDSYAIHPAALVGMSLPALVVHGTAATPVVQLTCERLAALLPQARLETIPSRTDSDATLSGDAGAALNALLPAFLTTADGSGIRPDPTP